MFQWEKGTFPNMRLHYLFAPCYHCENAVCVDAANGAMFKEEKYGAVLIDVDKATSIDLRKANDVCPYGAISFDSDAMNAKASKCTMCIDRLEQGLKPICAEACQTRAIDFAPIEDLVKKYGTLQQLEDMPSPDQTKPAVIFKAHSQKKTLVPYNSDRALELLRNRNVYTPLPPLAESKAAMTDVSMGLTGRNRLILKANNIQEAMKSTQHDD